MFNELETAPCCYDEADHNIMKYLISYFYANFKSRQMVKVCVSPLLRGATAAPLLSVTVILRL